jgi:hypothetical protein
MKAILEFELPEDEDTYEMHMKASDMYGVLNALAQDLRQKVKHGDNETLMSWSDVHAWFWDQMQEYDIDPLG